MAQHTAAPWTTFDTDGRSTDDPAVFAGKHCLAVVYANDLPRKQAVANTHLMAAAPDLLVALKWFIDDFDRNVERARQALAKAEGRS